MHQMQQKAAQRAAEQAALDLRRSLVDPSQRLSRGPEDDNAGSDDVPDDENSAVGTTGNNATFKLDVRARASLDLAQHPKLTTGSIRLPGCLASTSSASLTSGGVIIRINIPSNIPSCSRRYQRPCVSHSTAVGTAKKTHLGSPGPTRKLAHAEDLARIYDPPSRRHRDRGRFR